MKFTKPLALFTKTLLRGMVVTVSLASVSTIPAHAQSGDDGWVTSWATAMQGPLPHGYAAGNPAADSAEWQAMFAENTVVDQTFRFIIRPEADGTEVRLGFSNLNGDAPVTFTGVTMAARVSDRMVDESTLTPVLFSGSDTVTIPVGAEIRSDPVTLSVSAGQDYAVTVSVQGPAGAVTWHAKALTTSYASGQGDAILSTDAAGTGLDYELRSWLWLTELQVRGAGPQSVIIALGDSITDGSGASIDGYDRWVDALNRRLREAGSKMVIINAGIGSNRVQELRIGHLLIGRKGDMSAWDDLTGAQGTANAYCLPCGDPATVRLERDVFSRAGVTGIILFEGINDLSGGAEPGAVIAGMSSIIERAHARDLKVFGATVTPFGDSLYTDDVDDGDRLKINTWIREHAAYDAVLDFEQAVMDPEDPTKIRGDYTSPDFIHPGPDGYEAIANSIDLTILDPSLSGK